MVLFQYANHSQNLNQVIAFDINVTIVRGEVFPVNSPIENLRGYQDFSRPRICTLHGALRAREWHVPQRTAFHNNGPCEAVMLGAETSL